MPRTCNVSTATYGCTWADTLHLHAEAIASAGDQHDKSALQMNDVKYKWKTAPHRSIWAKIAGLSAEETDLNLINLHGILSVLSVFS